jgi:hypothetical protein
MEERTYFSRGDHSKKVSLIGCIRVRVVMEVGKFSFVNTTGRDWNVLAQEMVDVENGSLKTALLIQ